VDALGNMLVQGHVEAQEFLGLYAVYNSLSGPLFLLQEPYFDLNKSIIRLVFFWGFSRGLPESWCYYVLDLVSLFMLLMNVYLINQL
jgi:hypothetical protein